MIFKRLFKNTKYLYPDLPPKQRFLKILEVHVLPELANDGFRLLSSEPTFKKTQGSFEWYVDFKASRWNSANQVCQYNPYFTVKNSDYRKYLKQNPDLVHGHGSSGYIGTTAGKHHWDKSIFGTDGSLAYFLEDNDFSKHDNYELVKEMIKNIRLVGIPYFKMMSDFDSIRHFHISLDLRSDAPKLIDLCYVLDRKTDIKSIIDWYYASNENCSEDLEKEMLTRKNNWLQQSI